MWAGGRWGRLRRVHNPFHPFPLGMLDVNHRRNGTLRAPCPTFAWGARWEV